MFEKGAVVRSLAGRDSGRLLAVVRVSGGRAWLCDGKERPLNRPKSKNIRHVVPIGTVLNESELAGNRVLKKTLGRIDAHFNGNM